MINYVNSKKWNSYPAQNKKTQLFKRVLDGSWKKDKKVKNLIIDLTDQDVLDNIEEFKKKTAKLKQQEQQEEEKENENDDDYNPAAVSKRATPSKRKKSSRQ